MLKYSSPRTRWLLKLFLHPCCCDSSTRGLANHIKSIPVPVFLPNSTLYPNCQVFKFLLFDSAPNNPPRGAYPLTLLGLACRTKLLFMKKPCLHFTTTARIVNEHGTHRRHERHYHFRRVYTRIRNILYPAPGPAQGTHYTWTGKQPHKLSASVGL
ncbi:hypothetical protein C8F04DRAFT_1070452, partial [Mycena alexandri]